MIRYTDFDFSCPRNCGASWFVYCTQLAGYGPGFPRRAHGPLVDSAYDSGKRNGKLAVSMVAHPIDWMYRSFCSFYDEPLKAHMDIDRPELRRFITDYIDNDKKSLGVVINRYAADVVLRVEDMPDCAIELFAALGCGDSFLESINRGACTSSFIEKYRRNSITRLMVDRMPDLAKKIVDRDLEMCEFFDYYC